MPYITDPLTVQATAVLVGELDMYDKRGLMDTLECCFVLTLLSLESLGVTV